MTARVAVLPECRESGSGFEGGHGASAGIDDELVDNSAGSSGSAFHGVVAHDIAW